MSAELFSPEVMARVPVATVAAPARQTAAHRLTAFMRSPLGGLCLLVAAVLVVYAPSLNAQFLWDDLALVRNNLLIRSPRFCAEVFRHTLFDGNSNFYRPTQTLTFLADYWFWALNPFGYHLTSILIHAANAGLLFLVLRRTLPVLLGHPGDVRRAEPMAILVALLWAVHPVHSAAVAYVSGSADSLAMMCCLSAWLLCERALRDAHALPRTLFAAGAFLSLLFGLCSKEIAGIWLLLYLGYLFVAPSRHGPPQPVGGGARRCRGGGHLCRPATPATDTTGGTALTAAACQGAAHAPRARRLRQPDDLSGQAFHGAAGVCRPGSGKSGG